MLLMNPNNSSSGILHLSTSSNIMTLLPSNVSESLLNTSIIPSASNRLFISSPAPSLSRSRNDLDAILKAESITVLATVAPFEYKIG